MLLLPLAIAASLLVSQANNDVPSHDQLNRFMFFAVLEGLMEDGAPDPVIKYLLAKDKEGHYVNFVYGCKLCTPTIEAMRAFLMRRNFYFSRKGEPNFSQPRFSKDLEKQLMSKLSTERFRALSHLIDRYVRARFTRLRLTDAERLPWRHAIGTATGEAGKLPKPASMNECPTCEGSYRFLSNKKR